jgi:hypothetical protein
MPIMPNGPFFIGSAVMAVMTQLLAKTVARFGGIGTPQFSQTMASLMVESLGIFCKLSMQFTPVLASILTKFLLVFSIFRAACRSSHNVTGKNSHTYKQHRNTNRRFFHF